MDVQWTPLVLFRTLRALESTSAINQQFFESIDVNDFGKSIGIGNAAYIKKQAEEYLAIVDRNNSDDTAAMAFARSELSRILAIILRECMRLEFDFITALKEGVEYETAVVEDIQAGRRQRRSNRALLEMEEAE